VREHHDVVVRALPADLVQRREKGLLDDLAAAERRVLERLLGDAGVAAHVLRHVRRDAVVREAHGVLGGIEADDRNAAACHARGGAAHGQARRGEELRDANDLKGRDVALLLDG